MKKACVVSPKCTSESAKWLAETLEIPYHNPYRESRADFRDYKTVINYGISDEFLFNNCINKPGAINTCVDKLKTYEALKADDFPIPEHTLDVTVARQWLEQGYHVVCRKTATGKRSEGTIIVADIDGLLQNPSLYYTMYIPHVKELRVNTFKNKVLTVLEKVENQEDHTFTFKRLVGFKHSWLAPIVERVYNNIGLDFSGLDILLTGRDELVFLEANSGPALFGSTSVRLAEKLKKEINNA